MAEGKLEIVAYLQTLGLAASPWCCGKAFTVLGASPHLQTRPFQWDVGVKPLGAGWQAFPCHPRGELDMLLSRQSGGALRSLQEGSGDV